LVRGEFFNLQKQALSIQGQLRKCLEGHPLAELLTEASWSAFDARLKAATALLMNRVD
jgi:fructose-1,6-bisphosphatase